MKSSRILLGFLLVISGAAVTRAYVLNGPKWATQQVPYYINPANADMSESAAIDAIQQGAMAWTAQSNANIMLYYMGRTSGSNLTQNGRSEVFFRPTSAGGMAGEAYWWYDASYHLIEADVAFYDGGFKFFPGSSGCSGGIYLTDIATHELGHALGLGHSSVSSASMYPAMGWCDTSLRTLDSDDLAGIEKLYPGGGGSTSTNTAPTVQITAPSNGLTVSEGTSIAFAGSASDKEDGNLSGGIVWKSSIDGQIGTGASFSRTLSAGSHVITASVSDRAGATAAQQIGLSVTSLVTTPTASSILLTARGYKVKGSQRADLLWSGATSSTVDVYRDGARILLTANDGRETDLLNRKGGGTYTYKLCQAGTTTCSATVTVTF